MMFCGSSEIIRLSHIYATHRGLKMSSVSTYMSGSGDTLKRLIAGRDLTTKKAHRLVLWLSAHWPADLAWPADIPRPEREARD